MLKPDPEAHAYAHRTDPGTSREAAEKAVASGMVEADAQILLSLIQGLPGSTIPELARAMIEQCEVKAEFEYTRQRLGRRTGDLVRLKLAHARGKRDGCQLWWPGPEPEAAKQGALFETPQTWRTD